MEMANMWTAYLAALACRALPLSGTSSSEECSRSEINGQPALAGGRWPKHAIFKREEVNFLISRRGFGGGC